MACGVCGKSYVWNAEDENYDSDVKPHVCTTCGQSFSLKIQLKRHTLLHANGEPYVCINCSKNTKEESKSYNLRLSKKSDKYPCDICGESFSSKRMLLRHSTKEHCYENTNDSFDSDDDDYYGEPKKRKRHYRKRSNQKMDLEKCKTSNKVVDDPPTKSAKRVACSSCLKSFAFQSYLDRHIKGGKCKANTANDLLNRSTKTKKAEVVKTVGTRKTHVCNVCGKSFARKSSLEGHELTHVKDKFASDAENESNNDDDDNDEDFTQGDDSNDYIVEPKRPRISKIKIQKSYTCNQCNYVCFSKPTFDKHLNNHREKANGEEYERNEQSMSSEFFTIENTSEKGTGEKTKETHTCEICDKVFHTKGRLKRHLLFHVTRDNGDEQQPTPKWGWVKRKRNKDHSCDVCGKQFAGLTCLRKHSLKHTTADGNKERCPPKKKKVTQVMECQFCHEVFTGKRSTYIKHVHSHTPEVCGICDQRFVDRPSLREHCRVHVGTEEGRMFMECSQKALDAKNGLLPPEPKVEYIYLVLR